jgi:hypothetical protein
MWTRVAAGAAGLVIVLPGADARAEGKAPASGFGETPLSDSAAELRRADEAAARGDDAGLTWLLDEVVYRVESSGATTTRYRRIVAVDTAAGVEQIQTFTAGWSPWFEDRPVLQARILDRRDQFHALDPGTIEVGPPPAA